MVLKGRTLCLPSKQGSIQAYFTTVLTLRLPSSNCGQGNRKVRAFNHLTSNCGFGAGALPCAPTKNMVFVGANGCSPTEARKGLTRIWKSKQPCGCLAIAAKPTLTFSRFPVHSSVLPILGRFILVSLPGVQAPGLVASTMIGNDRLGVFGCGVFKPTTSERLGLSYTDTVLEIRPKNRVDRSSSQTCARHRAGGV